MLTVEKRKIFSTKRLGFFQHFCVSCFFQAFILLAQFFNIFSPASVFMGATAGIALWKVWLRRPRELWTWWCEFAISFLGFARKILDLLVCVVAVCAMWPRETRVTQEVNFAFASVTWFVGVTFKQWLLLKTSTWASRTFVVHFRTVTKGPSGKTCLLAHLFLCSMSGADEFRCRNNLPDGNTRPLFPTKFRLLITLFQRLRFVLLMFCRRMIRVSFLASNKGYWGGTVWFVALRDNILGGTRELKFNLAFKFWFRGFFQGKRTSVSSFHCLRANLLVFKGE